MTSHKHARPLQALVFAIPCALGISPDHEPPRVSLKILAIMSEPNIVSLKNVSCIFVDYVTGARLMILKTSLAVEVSAFRG